MSRDTIPDHVMAKLNSLALPSAAITYVRDSLLPSTQPNGTRSFTVNFPCRLTEEVFVLNSRDIEYAHTLALQSDPNVLYILPQPAKLEIDAVKHLERFYAPDFLVIWKNDRPPTLFETKPSSQLSKRVAQHPSRFVCNGPNGYDMPLAKEAAQKLGFEFRTVSELNLEETFLKNTLLLEPYHNWPLNPPATVEEKSAIKSQVVAQPGIKISEIIHESTERRADLVHHMLTTGEVFAHLSLEPLTEPNRVSLFPTSIRERAIATLHSANPASSGTVCPYVLRAGLQFTIKRRLYTVKSFDGEVVELQNHLNEISPLPISNFLNMLPEIGAFLHAQLTNEEKIKTLSDKDLAEMLRRYSLIQPYLLESPENEGRPRKAPKNRTIQRYLAAYLAEKARSGNGFLGLIPRTSERGSTASKFPSATMAIMHRVILTRYLRAHPRLTMQEAYYHFEALMKRMKRGHIPSYRTFVRECKGWEKGEREQRRWGSRIAQLCSIPSAVRSILGTPHGQRPFTVAHIDHTISDVALDHPDSAKKLLKPVHSPMVDATTNRVLAWATRLDGPNTDTIIQVLTHCVQRNHTIPSTIIVDWGPDFRSKWLQTTLGTILKTTIQYRPKASGPCGSPVEVKFRVADVRSNHRYSGSTEIMKRVRQVTPPVLPNKHTIWTLKDLTEQYEQYYATFNGTPYGNEKQSPDEREQELRKIFGVHPFNSIPSELLTRALLPFVNGTTRKVDNRCRIFVGRSYYCSDKLHKVRGKEVDVRHKPGAPKSVFVSHPDLDALIECEAVSFDLKYATTTADAIDVVAHKNLRSPEVKKRKHENWAATALARDAKEKSLRREKRQRKTADEKKSQAEDQPQSKASDNVVEFAYTQGGLINLRSMEGDQ